MGLGLWVWLEMEMEMVGFGWRGLGFSRFGRGGDRWSRWAILLLSRNWKTIDSDELGGKKLSFPAQLNAISFLYYLVDHDSDWASTRWIRCC